MDKYLPHYGLFITMVLIVIPIFIIILASIQKSFMIFIANKFLSIRLTGKILLTCIVGLVGGFIVEQILIQSGGELLSLVAFLLATWPAIILWTKNGNGDPIEINHKEAAILSAMSSLVTLVAIKLIYFAFYYAVLLGFVSMTSFFGI